MSAVLREPPPTFLSAPLPALAQFDALLKALYLGPMESPPWCSFLEALKQHMAGSHTTLLLRPAGPAHGSVVVVAGPTNVAVTDRYNGHYYELDPFARLPPLRVVTEADLMSTHEWKGSLFFQEFLAPAGIGHLMACDLPHDEYGHRCGLRVMRPPSGAPFGPSERELMRRLMPHLEQAVLLRSRMENISLERNLLAGTVERLQVGTITLDEKGQVLTINAQAQAVLDQHDGLSLVAGTLRTAYPEDQQRLRTLIDKALASLARGGKALPSETPALVDAVAISRPSGRSKLSALVRSLPANEWAEGWNRPRIAVLLRDPDANAQGSSDVLRRLFELTRAEANLALLMANGLTLEEAGDRLNIRRNTVRAHLRSIFSKMGVTRQTDLIRLVRNSVLELS